MSAAPHLIPVEPPRRRCHACGLWHCECDECEDCAEGECEMCDVEETFDSNTREPQC